MFNKLKLFKSTEADAGSDGTRTKVEVSRHARRHGRQHRRHPVRARGLAGRRRLPDHAVDADGRVLGRGSRPRATSTSPAGR